MYSFLLEKLNTLKEKYVGSRADQQDVVTIDNWIDKAKQLFLIKSLKDHDGVKYVLEIFQSEIDKINDQLLNQRDMGQDERYRFLDQRALTQKYLNLFNGVDEQLADLDEIVTREL